MNSSLGGDPPNGGAPLPLCWIILAGALSEALYIIASRVENLLESPFEYLTIHFALVTIYVTSVYLLFKPGYAKKENRSALWVVLGFAVIFRLTLLNVTPTLSGDIYRYVWDGKVILNGISPYRYPPGSASLAGLRDRFYPLINHKTIGSPYSPLTELIFASAAGFAPPVVVMKAPFVIFDLLTALVLIQLLKIMKRPSIAVIAYAWSPLVVFEVSGSGHADSLAIFFLILTITLLSMKKRISASLAMAMALLSKYFAVILAPSVIRRFGVLEWAIVFTVVTLFYAPLLPTIEDHFLAVSEVASSWRYNDSVYGALLWATGSGGIAKAICVGLFLTIYAITCFLKTPAVFTVYLLTGAMLLLSTTVHPWYLLWMAPFLCIYGNSGWLWLTIAAPLSYLFMVEPQMELYGLIRTFEYGPFVLLVMIRLVTKKRARQETGRGSASL
ncbi:MAG TPA: hypothetical protein ENI77_01790 [Nitrospirae bacterium]|nr:hypothetical protein [Nitrospirota bacterium]